LATSKAKAYPNLITDFENLLSSEEKTKRKSMHLPGIDQNPTDFDEILVVDSSLEKEAKVEKKKKGLSDLFKNEKTQDLSKKTPPSPKLINTLTRKFSKTFRNGDISKIRDETTVPKTEVEELVSVGQGIKEKIDLVLNSHE
jgi:hypothetical protein